MMDEFGRPFRAKVTAKTNSSGTFRYDWEEQWLAPTTGVDVPSIAQARRGSATQGNYALEINNRSVATNTIVTLFFRGMVLSQPVYEFGCPEGSVAGGVSGTFQVCEGDGALHSWTFANGILTNRT